MSIWQRSIDKSKEIMSRWRYPYSTLPLYGKKPPHWADNGISDDFAAEDSQRDALCLVYTILEVGMGKYYGHIAVIRNKNVPVLQAVFTRPLGWGCMPVFSKYSALVFFDTHGGLLIYDLDKKEYALYSCHSCDIATFKELSGDSVSVTITDNNGENKAVKIVLSSLEWHRQQAIEISI